MKYYLKRACSYISGIIAAGLLLLTGCGSDHPHAPSGEEMELTERSVLIEVYPGITELDGVVPRLTVSDEHETWTELYDPSSPDTYVFHYLNSLENASVIMTASSKGMTLLVDDPFQSISNPQAYIISKVGEDVTVSSGTYSKSNNDFNISSVERIKIESETKGSVTRGDDMDFARELVMKEILRPLSKVMSIAGSMKWPHCIKLYFQSMNDFIIPMLEGHLYSNNELEFQQKMGEKIFFNDMKKIIGKVMILDLSDKAYKIYKAALACYQEIKPYDGDSENDISDDFLFSTVNSYSLLGRESHTSSWAIMDESWKYKPTIQLISVREQTATVCGDFINSDGRFTVMGYYLYHNGKEIDKVTTTLDDTTPYTFSNLQKGETYTAMAFATVMGVTYYSSGVQFCIEGDLMLSASSLNFSETGGNEKVEVTLPSEDWTWEASSRASWCKVRLEKNSVMILEVSPSKEERETTVKVTAYSSIGKTQEKTLVVKQNKIAEVTKLYFSCSAPLISKWIHEDGQGDQTDQFDSHYVLIVEKKHDGVYLSSTDFHQSSIVFTDWKVGTKDVELHKYAKEDIQLKSFSADSTDDFIQINGTTEWTGINDYGKETFNIGYINIVIDLRKLSGEIEDVSIEKGKSWSWGSRDYLDYTLERSKKGILTYSKEFPHFNY